MAKLPIFASSLWGAYALHICTNPDNGIGRGTGGTGGGAGQLIPGVGLLEDLVKGVHGDWQKLEKALPGANLPYVTPIITAVNRD